jgi:hypothetical protein
MNILQVIILLVYTISTIWIFFFHKKFQNKFPAQYVKLIIRSSMFLFSIYIYILDIPSKNSFFYIIVAFAFTFIADCCFFNKKSILGIIFFIPTYLSIFYAFNQNFDFQNKLFALPFLVIFLIVFYNLQHYVDSKKIKLGTIVFGLILSASSWTLATTGYREFAPHVATMASMTGILLFTSDMFVAYSIFHPKYNGPFVCWLENIIWGTYMIGWTLLLLIMADTNILITR